MAEQKRKFTMKPAHRAYRKPKLAEVNKDLYDNLSESGWKNNVGKFTIPRKSGLSWKLQAGQTCRIVCEYGSQVGDVNMWNLHDPTERFYSGKTRQIHGGHLSLYDRLWSSHPHLRPLATITQDSLKDYGTDEDGFGVHDVMGTRCDPYTHKLITGELGKNTCHQNLTKAVEEWGLGELDVHDVFNIFMCTGWSRDTHEYMIRSSPAEKGDYIEWFAEIDLLVACSACPYGDLSIQCGDPVPEDIVLPLEVYIGQPDDKLLKEWQQQNKE